MPAVAQVAERGLEFRRPVTFLVSNNGSGKSTLVEAIAEGFRLDPYGGRASARTGRPDRQKTSLGEVLRLDTTAAAARMLGGPRLKKKGFFLRAETAFSMTEQLAGVPGYWAEDTSAMSHGEGFVTVFQAMMNASGFYVMDEPESALSFTACLHLVSLMHQLGETGAQVVYATHSPILASTPGADIIEVGDHGYRRTTWNQLELVDHWRRYLEHTRTPTCATSSDTGSSMQPDDKTTAAADARFIVPATSDDGLTVSIEPSFGRCGTCAPAG